MSGVLWWLLVHPWASWLLLALYVLLCMAVVRLLLPSTPTGRPAARHRLVDLDEHFETLPSGVAGPGRETKARILAEIAAMGPPPLTVYGRPPGRGVTPVDGTPVVRLHSCQYCADGGTPGGCPWCGCTSTPEETRS